MADHPDKTQKPKETSLYLPGEVKSQLESLKIVPSEPLVDVVRRLIVSQGPPHVEQPLAEGETVTVVLVKKNYAQLQMVLQGVSPPLADVVARSRK